MSNLTLCDDGMVLLLKEIDPQFVNVSLYAVTESIHDSITQMPGSCAKTKAAIDALQKAGVHVRLATPFMRENKGCVEELKAFAAERNVHLIADSEIFGQLDHSCKNQSHALSLSELLKGNVQPLTPYIGRNYARRSRIRMKAALAAANLGRFDLINDLIDMAENGTEGEKEHAAWALAALEKNKNV